jgi:hypothetical protein
VFYYGVVLKGEHLRSSLEEYVLANKTNLEHEINIEFVDGIPPLAVMLVRCYPNVTFPRLQTDLTYEEEGSGGKNCLGSMCFFVSRMFARVAQEYFSHVLVFARLGIYWTTCWVFINVCIFSVIDDVLCH